VQTDRTSIRSLCTFTANRTNGIQGIRTTAASLPRTPISSSSLSTTGSAFWVSLDFSWNMNYYYLIFIILLLPHPDPHRHPKPHPDSHPQPQPLLHSDRK
ncbi:unnamed protein product, partial [Nesidiocoris tenuis]